MIIKRDIEAAVRAFERIREEHPTLTSEEAAAILVAASNDAVAQAVQALPGNLILVGAKEVAA